MDSFNRSKGDGQGPPRGRAAGTGRLDPDAFRSTSQTGALGGRTTKRLGSTALNAEQALSALQAEVENGQIIVSKLESRIKVLTRATSMLARPLAAGRLCEGLSPGEANFTRQVVVQLQQDQALLQRVQVACYQYEQASKGLEAASLVLSEAERLEGVEKAQYVEANCQVEKLRGQLYPLVNLHVAFKDNPLLKQLIPTPKPAQAPAPSPPPPVPTAPPPPPPGRSLSGPLSGDPAVAEVLDTLSRVTGSLKNKFQDLFKRK